MIHVKVDLIPSWAGEPGRETLTDLFIVNDGTGNTRIANYDVYTEDPREGDPEPVVRIPQYNRQWGHRYLASKALKAATARGVAFPPDLR